MRMRMKFKLLLGCFLLSTTATSYALPIYFGVKAGVPLNDAFNYQSYYSNRTVIRDDAIYSSATNRYTVGSEVELSLPKRFSIEFNALYKHLSYEFTHVFNSYSSGFSTSMRHHSIDRWEFPLLLKYSIPIRTERFFVEAGPTWNYVSNWKTQNSLFSILPFPYNSQYYSYNVSSDERPLELLRPKTSGIVTGGGWNFRLGVLRISPELRYTRWLNQHFSMRGPYTSSLKSNQNQIDFLLGVTFGQVARRR